MAQAEVVHFALDESLVKRARAVPLIGYIMAQEPGNIKKSTGGGYELRDHDSLKISDNGKWFWHSRGFGGFGSLDFLMKVRDVKFTDAVEMLTGEKAPQYNTPPPKAAKEPERKQIYLPLAHKNNDRVIAYLRSRGIDRETLMRCVADKSLYESKNGDCVFVGKDENGAVKSAFVRGTKDSTRKDAAGSDKSYGFIIPPETNSGIGFVTAFEAAIDALSHVSLAKAENWDFDCYRLSLGGVSPKALLGFLERNPGIKRVALCLDRDDAGIVAAKSIRAKLAILYPHIKVTVHTPAHGKDFNECLQEIQKTNPRQKQAADRKESAI